MITTSLPRRIQEIGKIRIGCQVPIASGKNAGKPRPERLRHFRLSSNSQSALQLAAKKYGGEVQRWTIRPEWQERIPTPDHQFELYTTSDTLDILIRADALMNTQFEQWDGAYCTRRCSDGFITFDGYGKLQGLECQCPADLMQRKELAAQGKACSAVSRLCVMLEGLPLGQWRLDTRGENTPAEVRGLQDILESCGVGSTMLRATMRLEFRTSRQMLRGQKELHHYSCVVIEPRYTPEQLLAEGERVHAKQLMMPALPDESTKTMAEHMADLGYDADSPATASTPTVRQAPEHSLHKQEKQEPDAIDVESQPIGTSPTTTDTRPAGEAGAMYSVQIEAVISARHGDLEAFWVQAETDFGKPRTALSVHDLILLLKQARELPSTVATSTEGPMTALKAVMVKLGWTAQEQKAWENKQARRFKKTFSDLPPETLQGLLLELQATLPKEQPVLETTPLEMAGETQGATEVTTSDSEAKNEVSNQEVSADSWREELASLLKSLEDTALSQEAGSLLEDAEVNDRDGDAMLQRVMNALDVQDEQAGLPF
jgi:hypothetical protein